MNKPITAGHPALVALQDALGLHGVPVKKIVLTADADDVVTLEVTSHAQESDIEDLVPVVKRYAWVEQVEPANRSHHVKICEQAEATFRSLDDPKRDDQDKISTRSPV